MLAVKRKWIVGVTLGLILTLSAGCDRPDSSESSANDSGGGGELWAHNCRRCHNLRPPNSLSRDQWEVVVNHMRVRAGLSARDAHKIEQFLKTAAN